MSKKDLKRTHFDGLIAVTQHEENEMSRKLKEINESLKKVNANIESLKNNIDRCERILRETSSHEGGRISLASYELVRNNIVAYEDGLQTAQEEQNELDRQYAHVNAIYLSKNKHRNKYEEKKRDIVLDRVNARNKKGEKQLDDLWIQRRWFDDNV